MNPIKTSHLPKAFTLAYFLSLEASASGAILAGFQLTPGMLPSIAFALALVILLLISYKLHKDNSRLREEAKSYKNKLSEYVSMHEEHAEPAVSSPEKPVTTSESTPKAGNVREGIRAQYTKRLYWDRLNSTMTKSNASELTGLNARKNDISEIIRIAREKLVKNEIDQKSFDDIMAEHQRRLIEVEAKISKLQSGQEPTV